MIRGDYHVKYCVRTAFIRPNVFALIVTCNLYHLALDVMAFERLLGPCMDIMKRGIDDYEEQLRKLGLSNTDLR